MRKHKVVEKTWGKEIHIENNDMYCLKILMCNKDKWSSEGKWHYHKKKDEVFYPTEVKSFVGIWRSLL